VRDRVHDRAPHAEADRTILKDVVRASADQPAADIVSCVSSAIDAFARDAPQFDDITLCVIKRNEQPLAPVQSQANGL